MLLTTKAVGRQNVMQHLVSDIADHDVDTPVKLHQDVQLYASEVDAGKAVNFDCVRVDALRSLLFLFFFGIS